MSSQTACQLNHDLSVADSSSEPLLTWSVEQYIKQILLAPVYDVAQHTPLSSLHKLSARLGHKISLKREDMQPVHSFKIRGAYNKIVTLSASQRAAGVIAASAGNHAQGVALSSTKLAINATIVMPITTPEIKVSAVKRLGADVVLHGKNFDEAQQQARCIARETGATFIPPFDDANVIAGQGTVAKELLEQQPKLDAVFIPVGGGGLLAGMALYIKYLMPSIKVIGVEPHDAACFQHALTMHHANVASEAENTDTAVPAALSRVGTFADGVAVKQMGKETFRLASQYCDEVITVSSDEICAAIKDIFDDVRAIAEPAGALALAGLKKYAAKHHEVPLQLSAVLSGANMNFDTLRYVSERTELGEQKEAVLAVKIPEHKGSYLAFCQALGGKAITEFNYRQAASSHAHIYVGIKLTEGAAELTELKQQLSNNSYEYVDMSDDETAKLHVRHMVGGRSNATLTERVYRFEFPECSGALLTFLDTLGARWNITLFHYRNHGAAIGQVLAGFELPDNEHLEFHQFLTALGYGWKDETNNPSYQLFLQ
ncbi:threonine ammonia-lyase, biosynthetic [Flocculibacter collagenilyticus]|uniref:threonine ammonia-lyase, biosynthetic n=1 Tax=Flocculibacter collagenilyticus TaxID=2744479 RepID=UPI0018F52289|nr:threonine ammonia-lyase, biosynthetic [Flocculibacter collagenilyticus]